MKFDINDYKTDNFTMNGTIFGTAFLFSLAFATEKATTAELLGREMPTLPLLLLVALVVIVTSLIISTAAAIIGTLALSWIQCADTIPRFALRIILCCAVGFIAVWLVLCLEYNLL